MERVAGSPAWEPTRRQVLRCGVVGLVGLSALACGRERGATLPAPEDAPFDHVVVVMMENRSFDHLLGWLPGADGRQAGLTYADSAGRHMRRTTWASNGVADTRDGDHTWHGGSTSLNGGRCDGFLRTVSVGELLPIGYYTEGSIPILGALARNYTTLGNYFSSVMTQTLPNRLYQHAARTDRDVTAGGISDIEPTIWDRLDDAGLEGRNYAAGAPPFVAIFGDRYTSTTRSFDQFLSDCTTGSLPHVAFVDPDWGTVHRPNPAIVPIDGGLGTSTDMHPASGLGAGDAFIGQVYRAVRESPNWDRTVLVVNFDEWGGFFDHVPPPRVVDDYVSPEPGPHPDYRQLGFRVPCVVISPWAAKGVTMAGGPYEHTSVLRMIEWRWGLPPMTSRDANARNLAEVLKFSARRSDRPAVPSVAPVSSPPCP